MFFHVFSLEDIPPPRISIKEQPTTTSPGFLPGFFNQSILRYSSFAILGFYFFYPRVQYIAICWGKMVPNFA
jgi:hypothetical protein